MVLTWIKCWSTYTQTQTERSLVLRHNMENHKVGMASSKQQHYTSFWMLIKNFWQNFDGGTVLSLFDIWALWIALSWSLNISGWRIYSLLSNNTACSSSYCVFIFLIIAVMWCGVPSSLHSKFSYILTECWRFHKAIQIFNL